MDLKQILFPFIDEGRRRFGNNSLLFVIDSIEIVSQQMDSEPRRKPLLESIAGLNNLTFHSFCSGSNTIQGYIGEIRYWQAKLCRNLDEISINAFKIHILDPLPLNNLKEISVWKKKIGGEEKGEESQTLLCFNFHKGNQHVVLDGEILTCLEYSLQVHYESALQILVEDVEQVALPVALSGQFWVAITEYESLKANVKLYDFDGFECGFIRRISFNIRFPKSFKNIFEIPVESRPTEGTCENLVRDDSNLDESHIHDRVGMKTIETYCLSSSNICDDNIVRISEFVTSEKNKLLVLEKVRRAVELIGETPCNDNLISFISLGFDSLKLAKLDFVLQNEFSGKFSIPYGSAHQYPSINALSEYVLKCCVEANTVPESMGTRNFQFLEEKLAKIVRSNIEIPLSSAQKRLVFLYQLNTECNLNFAETLKLSIKSLKTHRFQKAFNRVVARHTALRTIYTTTGQTILSLTEVYFRISVVTEYVFRSLEPLDLFDFSVPIRIFIIQQKGSRCCEELVESHSDRIYQIENQWIPRETRTASMQVTNMSSSDLVVIQMHHIMIDGFSIKLVTNELRTLYYEKNQLKSSPYQYSHFVLQEDQQRQDSESRRLREAFWQRQILEIVLQTLPVDGVGFRTETYSGRCLQFQVDPRIRKCLQDLASWCSVTQFSVLFANLQLLHYKRYGSKDSCIGIAVAQRETPELCTVVGCLLNVVPVINTIDPNDRIYDFITESDRRVNESIKNQLQFDDLIKVLRLRRDLTNSPLFQVLFILDDSYDTPFTEHYDCVDDSNESNFGQYDQVWYVQYHKDGITVKIDYNGSRFYKSTIEAMIDQYFRLLHKMSQNLDKPVKSIKMISSMEEFLDYKLRFQNRCDFPQMCTVLDLMDGQSRMNPYCNKVVQRGVPFSSAFLQRKSNQLSRFFTQSWFQFLGEDMRTDDLILLVFDRSVFLFLAIFALWKCGAAVAPLNLETSSEQLNEIQGKLNRLAIIYECKQKEQNVPTQSVLEIPSKNLKQNAVFEWDISEVIALISGYSDQPLRKKLAQHNLAYMTFSSGSTGIPKGICTEFYGLNNLVVNYAEQLSIKAGSNIYQVVNPAFDIYFADILQAQTNGASLYLASQRIPDLLEMSKVTHAYIMPAYLSVIQLEQLKNLTNLEQLHYGGDYIQHRVLRDAIRIGLRFHNQYGITEHSIYSTCKFMKTGAKTSSVGKPFRNVHFFIRDSDNNLCGQRITGICCTSGVGISRGYHGNEHLNQISFFTNRDLTKLELLLNYDKRFFYTGDLAEMKNSIGELFFHGRKDSQVKIRGNQVDIPAIEAVLGRHHSVKESVVCLHRTEREEFLIAYIISYGDFVMDEEEEQLITKSLHEYMLMSLPSFMTPTQYVFLKQFPLINGKINRKLLPTPRNFRKSKACLETECIFEPKEKQVMEIFAALLPGKTILSLDDSFFQVGGDSLKALIAIQKVKHETGLDLSLRDLFLLPSFRAILQCLRNSKSTVHEEVENVKSLKSVNCKSNSMQIYKKVKLTSDSSPAKMSSEHEDEDSTMSKRLAKKSDKIHSNGTESRSWFDEGIPVSLQQERLLFLYSLGKEFREGYKLQFSVTFCAPVNVKVLNIALNYVVRKHHILHAVFPRKAGKTIQEVVSLTACYIEVHRNMLRNDTSGSRIRLKLPEIYDEMPLLAVSFSSNLELVLILDHLIVDGRSIAILTNDLAEIYNVLVSGNSVSFDVANSSYAEFASRQRKELEKFEFAFRNTDCHLLQNTEMTKDELKEQKSWRHLKEMILRLQNFPPLSFQGDLPNGEFDRRNNVIKLKMPVDLSAIKHFCMAERCTLFAYLLGAFSLTVHFALTDQRRFAVVTSALNRTCDTMNCVGLFVNTVIIPIEIDFESVSGLLHNIQQNIAEALQFQHIPFDCIIRMLNPKRSIAGAETYQISFVVQNASITKVPAIDGVETVTEDIGSKYAKYDQAWYFTEFDDQIEMSVEYRSGKYSDLKIKHVMSLFIQTASQMLSNRSAKLNEMREFFNFVNTKEPKIGRIEDENLEDIADVQGVTVKTRALQEALLGIWKETFGSLKISISDNFFAIGGHSLMIPSICYQIEQQISYQCPPQAIYKYQTIKELAEYISDKKNSKAFVTFPERLTISICPLQESLIKMYYNVLIEEATTTDLIKAYQTGFSISLKSVNLSKLTHSLNLIIMLHPALRTTFYRENNNFFQEIHSGTEMYIIPRKSSPEHAAMIVANPFHEVPILLWLVDEIKEKPSDESCCQLHLKLSHAICDGKSLSIIAKELSDNYLEGKHISMKDENFIQFSRRTKQRFRERHSEMQTFWSQTLRDAENVHLYHDKLISTVSNSYRCNFLCKKFKNLNSLTKQVAKKCYCSPFVVQLAAFSRALSEVAVQAPKMLISYPVDLRDSEAQQSVGMCINVLPVIINLELKNYEDLIQAIARSLADAYVNADISTEEMEKLCRKYGVSNFADIMIVSNYEQCYDQRYQTLNDNSEFTKCALTLFLTQQNEDIVAKIEYKQNLYYGKSLSTMLNHWARTIRKMEKVIVARNEMKFGKRRMSTNDIPLAVEYFSIENNVKNTRSKEKAVLDEREEYFTRAKEDEDGRILRKFDYPAFSYQHLLREAFLTNDHSASMTALIGSKEKMNFGILTGLIHRTSKIVRDKVAQITGRTLRADTVIPVIAQNSIKTIVTCLAIVIAGAAYLPIDSTSPTKRILNILEQMGAGFYITVGKINDRDDEFQDPLNFSFQNAVEIDLNDIGLEKKVLTAQEHLRNTQNDLAYVIFTSGSTGKPKGVAIGQRGLLNLSVACTRDFWMKAGDCVYQFTNFAFDNSVLEIMMALINGGALLLRENFFTSQKFLDEMKRGQITHALLFPGLVSTFTDEEIDEMRHLRYWIVGAETASKRVLECALKSGVNVIQNYGPTETTAYALTKRMKLLDRPNNIGRGIMNVVASVRNFCGEDVLEMGVGELCITGKGIMRGYIVSDDGGRREDEKKRITFGTKDIVRLQPNNDILFLGRYDEQVKIRGYRVELGEIEAVLCQYPQVKSAKVISKSTEGQQQLVAFIILSSGLKRNEFHLGTARQFMLEHLPYYMVPTQYHFLQQYPLTANSKVDVTALQMLQNPEHDFHFQQIEPENSIECKLLGFVRQVLQNTNISINDDFFAVGGNSFSAAQLTELIETSITDCIGIDNVFRHRTVRRLSEYISHSCKGSRVHEIQDSCRTNEKVLNLDDIPLSFQQQQFRFLNETKQRKYYELIFVQKFDSSVSLTHLKLAFLRLILRQPSLRTIFLEQNYEAHQEILSGTEAYFCTNILQSSYFTIGSLFSNEDLIVETAKMLQDEKMDLTSEPPILCSVERSSDSCHTVILRINHIISDAWSTNLLENELRDLYEEVRKNKQFYSNSRLSFTYAEYAIEQCEQKHFLERLASEYADRIATWITSDPNYNNILQSWERFEGQMNLSGQINEHLDSRTCRKTIPHPKSTDFANYSQIEFTFEVKKIEKICGSFEVTPAVAFLCAFALSLHELSDSNQLIITVPTANRSIKTGKIIGNFLNYLLINSTYNPFTKRCITNAACRNPTDSTKNPIKAASFNEQKEGISFATISARFMKQYVENVNRTVNEIRQFEQVPFITLLKLIRIKLKELKRTDIEILDRLHKTIFFNFRYGLEENRESVLGKGETLKPAVCVHDIEVEIDRVKGYYFCKIRMKNHVSVGKRVSALCQQMISSLHQMTVNPNLEVKGKYEIKPEENVCEVSTNLSASFANDQGGNVIEVKLGRIWSECLKKRWIEDDDNFFLEGGTSLLTLKLKRLIESRLKIHIELDEIFQYSTFKQLSNLLQKRFNNKDYSAPDKRIGLFDVACDSDNDSISHSDRKGNIVQKTEKSQTPENRTTIRMYHESESNVAVRGSAVIVFFHALVGGVTWTYASFIRRLIAKLPGSFTIIGVEHPDTFSRRYSKDPKFYQSIESLCSKYVRDLHQHLSNVKIRVFIGASFGAILAYQCAVQLQREGKLLFLYSYFFTNPLRLMQDESPKNDRNLTSNN